MRTAILTLTALVLSRVALAADPTALVVGEGLNEPFGVDFDAAGNTYIVEMGGNRVSVLDASGRQGVLAGTGEKGFGGDGGPAAEARFDGPHHLLMGPDDHLYVADTWNNAVRRIDLETRIVSRVAGTGEKGFGGDGGPAREARFDGVYSIAFGGGTLYVCDLGNRRVRAVDLASGVVTTVAGNGEKGVPRDGALATAAPLVDPRAIAVDPRGELYIAERGGHALRVVDAEGRIRTVAGDGTPGYSGDGGPALEARLNGPKHVAVDAAGDVLITDTENHVIRRYSRADGTIRLVAGTGERGASGLGGPPQRLSLARPHGAFPHPRTGDLYVSDSDNHRVVRVAADPYRVPPPDRRELVSGADLRLDRPAARSEEGLPIGNGRAGSLVWTTPTALRFQINRVDVQPINRETRSFFERHGDYCCGAGFLDVDVGGGDVFVPPAFSRHLSVYDGRLAVDGKDVAARILTWHERDVIAIEIEDRRPEPQPLAIALRMLRFVSQYDGDGFEAAVESDAVTVRTRHHSAASRLHLRGDTIGLTQDFREGSHRSRSAVAVRVAGRPAVAGIAHESEARLRVPAAAARLVVLVASAASLDEDEDTLAAALRSLDAAEAKGFAGLARDNEDWWHAFWERGFVDLASADGVAEEVERGYLYFLYLMGSTSRGAYPPKFNGMLWNTRGDVRAWGAQHWFANLSCYYEALPAANRLELMDPVFDMYGGAYDSWATAARQQWGSEGIFIPETAWFDGLAVLPDDVAEEMRELYLLRKPWDERSERFRELALTQHPLSSRWNWKAGGSWVDGRWVAPDKGAGPFGHVTHILGTTAKVAYLFWRRWEYTLDRAWLREGAYPMLRGAAEFYRSFPNLKKGEDGRYHIHRVNSNESVWGARDTDEDLSAMRGVLAAALRASQILGVDPDLRPAWRELLENLAPLPVSDQPDALVPDGYVGPRVFVRGLGPAVRAESFLPDPNSMPLWFFDLAHVESADRERLALANATFDAYFEEGIGAETTVGVLSKLAIAAAALGRADAVRVLLPSQMRALRREREGAYGRGGVLANRLTLREGHQALGAQRLGRAAESLHQALLQSSPPEPAGDPVIRVFPAWPREWDATYTLRARGAFLVSASIESGRIGFVELRSLAGAQARLRNPWGAARVRLYRDGAPTGVLGGSLLVLETRVGETVWIVPSDPPAA